MYIKTFESFETTKKIICKFYRLYYWNKNSTIVEYEGTDYEEAKREFDTFGSSDLDSDVYGEYNRIKDGYYVTVFDEE